MEETNRKWRAELGKAGPALSARTIRIVMSFLDEMRPSMAAVGRALLGLCAPGVGGRSTNIPLLEDTMVTMDDLLSFQAVRRQCPESDYASFFVWEQIGRLKATRVNWWREAELRVRNQAVSYGDDAFLDIVDVEWNGVPDAHTLWRVRGGQWAYWGMNALGRVSLCRLAKASLLLPNKASVELATRVLIRTALSSEPWRLGSRSSITIGSLLEQVGELLPRERRNPEWAQKTAHRLEVVLRALVEVGALAEFTFPTSRHSFVTGASIERWLHEQLPLAFVMLSPEAPHKGNVA